MSIESLGRSVFSRLTRAVYPCDTRRTPSHGAGTVADNAKDFSGETSIFPETESSSTEMLLTELRGVEWGWRRRSRCRLLHLRTLNLPRGAKAKVTLEGYGGTRTFVVDSNGGVDLSPLRHWLSAPSNRRRVEDAWICHLLHRGWLRVEAARDTLTLHPGHELEDEFPITAFFEPQPASLTFDGASVRASMPLRNLLWRDKERS